MFCSTLRKTQSVVVSSCGSCKGAEEQEEEGKEAGLDVTTLEITDPCLFRFQCQYQSDIGAPFEFHFNFARHLRSVFCG